MDNKQKKKIYKKIYSLLSVMLMVFIAFSIYVAGKELYNNTSIYLWFDISIIIIQAIFAFLLLYDGYRTRRSKNKYCLAVSLVIVASLIVVGFCTVWALEYFNQLIIVQNQILSLTLLLINQILLILIFALGLKISRLYLNTTITIDSTSQIPNYSDELLLKKKLDELNRKLEIKKVQEQIDKIEKELDNK